MNGKGETLKDQVLHNFICVARLHKKAVDCAFAKTELYGSEHRMLMHLSRCGSISQTELARSLEISTATVAITLKKLEKRGYIRKLMDEEDNRYNRIDVTQKGQYVIQESKRIFHQTDEKFLEGFTEEELAQLNQFLLRMKEKNKEE